MTMLTEDEQREIQQELSHYPNKRAACVEALKVVQRHRTWISDESLREVSALLEMTPEELDGVATFYNLIYRKPVGRHVALVCNSISCWMMGYDALLERLKKGLGTQLGQTTSDGRFTLLPVVCLGACDHAPVMMIDSDLHRHVTPDNVEELLNRYK
jgi:NADH-quinone oxidoreductase subunit E